MNISWKWAAGLGLSALLIIGNVWQLYRNSQLRSELIQAGNNEIFWHMQYLNCKQSPISFTGIGDYHEDTVKTNAGEARQATIPLKTPDSDNQAAAVDTRLKTPLMSFISFDTTARFGLESNPERIRVAGKFYTDPAYKSLNRLDIYNLGYEKPTTLPPEPIIKNSFWMIGGGPGIFSDKMAGKIELSRIGEHEGISGEIISDLKNWGGFVSLSIKF